jgi:uncharacterized membrane protein
MGSVRPGHVRAWRGSCPCRVRRLRCMASCVAWPWRRLSQAMFNLKQRILTATLIMRGTNCWIVVRGHGTFNFHQFKHNPIHTENEKIYTMQNFILLNSFKEQSATRSRRSVLLRTENAENNNYHYGDDVQCRFAAKIKLINGGNAPS